MSEVTAAARVGGGDQDRLAVPGRGAAGEEIVAAPGSGDFAVTWHVVAFDRLDSTNDEARRQARAGAPDGTVIWAGCQDAGRGRRGRVWASPLGNLYCSLILRPPCSSAVAAQLSFVAALAVAEAVAGDGPGSSAPRLKWPNDVLVDGRKVAGILLESDPDALGGVDWLVVGVGINVAHFPRDAEFPAAALVPEGGTGPAVAVVLQGLLDGFARWYRLWGRSGLAPIRTAWLERAAGLGEPVTVRLADRTLFGRMAGLDADGALLLEPADGGAPVRVAAGDVFFPGTAAATVVAGANRA